MKTVPILTGCLLLGALAAQDPVDPKPDKAPTAAERMQELQDLRQKCIDDWRKAVQAAQEAAKNRAQGQVAPAMPMRPDFGPVATKALACAKDYAGTDDAVDFLLMVVNLDQKQARPALETLLEHHLDSPKLASMGSMIPYLGNIVDEPFAAQARAKLMKSKSVDVRGWAMFAAHQDVIKEADRDGNEYKDARAKLLAVADEVSDERLADEIRGAIDEREKFGVGNVAPDIAGVDLDGVEFKLSDYKGKVIFLDFWGDW